MKHIFKQGYIREVDGVKRLKFLWSTDTYAETDFDRSFFNISRCLDLYDFEKVEELDYYYIFQKYGKENLINEEEIREAVRNLFNKNWKDVISPDDFNLGFPDKDEECDVFWDVNNDLIIVKGKENLKALVYYLYLDFFEKMGLKRFPEQDEEIVNKANDTAILTRVMNFKKNNAV